MMSMHTFLRFIKQMSRLNNSFDFENYRVVDWMSLKIIGRVSRCGVLKLFIYTIVNI